MKICMNCAGTGWQHPDDPNGKCQSCDGRGTVGIPCNHWPGQTDCHWCRTHNVTHISDVIEIDGTHYAIIWSVLLPDSKRRPLAGVRCYSKWSAAVAEAERLWPELCNDRIVERDERQSCEGQVTLDANEYKTSVEKMIGRYIREIAEFPNRTSPDGMPEMLMLTENELADILRRFADELDEPLEDDPCQSYQGCPV